MTVPSGDPPGHRLVDRGGDVVPNTYDSRGTLLFLISESEERADNRQKQNPVTSPTEWSRAQGQNGINGGQPVGRTLLPGSALRLLQGRPHRSGRARFGHPVPRSYSFAVRCYPPLSR